MINPSLIHETGHSEPVHWDYPEGWDGEGGASGVQDEGHMYTMADSYGKTITIL